jgi:DNA-binding protein H-NS
LDTTIEFADGTQYKIEQAQADSAAQSVAGDDELREPGPGELALREKPLPPGEVVVPPKREERFGDDYDRSWPRRPSGAGDGKTLFNERIGRLEPAGSSKRGGPPPPSAAEPSAILRPRERRPSEGPPHMASHGSEPKARRPSVTSPRATHAALPPTTTARRPSMNEPKPTAWGRRSSVVMNDRPPPPHFGSASASGGTGGRELPPHMLQQQQREQRRQPHPAEAPALSAGRGPLSPPSQRAPLPPSQSVKSPPVRDQAALPAGSAPAPTAPTEPPAASATPAEPVVSLEEMHAREMHAAAERAKKRREEEEQKRLEQIERAKRKAAELEEKMKAADEAKAKAKAEEEKAKAEAKAAAAPPPPRPAAPVSAADKVSSWRAVPKPGPAPSQPTASSSSSQSVPTRVLAREAAQPRPAAGQAPAKPTSILARPAQPASTHAQQPAATPALPTQASAWRQSQASKNVSSSTAPGRQLPPHLAARAAAAEAADSAAQASTQKPPARPSTPPPPAAGDAKVSSPPTSPAHRRDNSQSSKSGYKLPAVAQLDDLMSRIKGAMAPAADGTTEETAPAPAAAVEEPERVRVKLPTAVAPVETTTVRLPRGASTRASAPSVTPPAIRGRGRGRGRVEAQPNVRSSGPQFESREPTLPFHSSRIARSQSPPPAWRQYTVRLASHPVRRRPQSRQIKNFESQKYPQPLYPFSWYPVLRDANPRRLSRDDLLLPKRYAANGTPIFTVRLGPRVVRRSTTREKSAPPAPTVSISKKSLVRLPEQVLEPATSETKGETAGFAQTSAKPIDAVFGASALSTALGSEESSRASAWRLAAVSNSNTAAQDVSDSAGSLSALSRASGTPTYSMTGELNGEKIEATPRKETAAPGLDAAALRMVSLVRVLRAGDVY